ncbi:MAG: thymidylate synthase [Tissierellia bacterium]|nr:thymidylate synthase [Tissierellia bacterium]
MRVDEIYIDMAADILENGVDEQDVSSKVRAVWNDGKSAYTKYLTQKFVEYKEGEVPIISLRKIAWKSAIKEILWIYKDKSNDVNVFNEKYNVKYWDSWKDQNSTLGKAYGYQTAKKFISPETKKPVDQVERLIEQLKTNPLNRRLIINLYDVDDLSEMTLIPCAFMTLWTVREDKLDLTLIQRSGDFLAAAAPGNINAFQYYVLLRMICQVTGFKPGKFTHFIQNIHIYKKHIPIVKKIIEKEEKKDSKPILKINPEVKRFEDFDVDDFELIGYKPYEDKYSIDIAI